MQIKLLDIYPPFKPGAALLGQALIQLADKMKVLMNIYRSKAGALFVKFPSSKIGDFYIPHVEFLSGKVENDINTAIKTDLSLRMNKPNATANAPQTAPAPGFDKNDEFPF